MLGDNSNWSENDNLNLPVNFVCQDPGKGVVTSSDSTVSNPYK